jgi:hypothetical protein
VMANGICVQAAAGATLKDLREVAAMALASWPASAAAAPKKSRIKEPA